MPPKGKTLTVDRFFKDNEKILKLKWISGRKGGERHIREGSVVRPGLALTGFFDYFADKRIHVIGMSEISYLGSLPDAEWEKRVREYFAQSFPCLIFARELAPEPLIVELSNELDVPVFISSMVTYNVSTRVTLYLERELSPTVTVMGSLVEIQGTGVLVRGESGVGKSECILALLRRGAALVADDVIKISRAESGLLFGTVSLEEMRGYIEIRGLGLINVIQLFGISSFRLRKEVDLVVTLKHWEQVEKVDRTGLESETYRILGLDIPHVTIPVAPGRETANLVELAAQEFRTRNLGVHAGKSLNEAIIKRIANQ